MHAWKHVPAAKKVLQGSDHSIPVMGWAPERLRSREVTGRWDPSSPAPLLLQRLSSLVHLSNANADMALQSCPEPSSALQPRVRHKLLPALAVSTVSSRCWVATWQSRGHFRFWEQTGPHSAGSNNVSSVKKNNNQDFSQ